LRQRVQDAQAALAAQASERLANVHMPAIAWPHLPHLPTPDDMRAKAREMFVATPSMEQIAHRAHQMVAEAVWGRLISRPL
jgi:stearoyl-CoA desaturase (delta-9 desaturase)